ncbi:MAG: hypothetical protein ACLTCP_08160 [Ruminococcus bicirculans (ex Wegman et al. 2014)]
MALCRIAKAWACYKGREYVVPQDVRDFCPCLQPQDITFCKGQALRTCGRKCA